MKLTVRKYLYLRYIELDNKYLRAERDFYNSNNWDENKYQKMRTLEKEKDKAYDLYEGYCIFRR